MKLTANEYQNFCLTTALYREKLPVSIITAQDLLAKVYPALGLVGEAGEIANKIKKTIRDGTPLDKKDLTKELGDVLWYVATLADEYEITLQDIIDANVKKLSARKDKGTIRGSGDNRQDEK